MVKKSKKNRTHMCFSALITTCAVLSNSYGMENDNQFIKECDSYGQPVTACLPNDPCITTTNFQYKWEYQGTECNPTEFKNIRIEHEREKEAYLKNLNNNNEQKLHGIGIGGFTMSANFYEVSLKNVHIPGTPKDMEFISGINEKVDTGLFFVDMKNCSGPLTTTYSFSKNIGINLTECQELGKITLNPKHSIESQHMEAFWAPLTEMVQDGGCGSTTIEAIGIPVTTYAPLSNLEHMRIFVDEKSNLSPKVFLETIKKNLHETITARIVLIGNVFTAPTILEAIQENRQEETSVAIYASKEDEWLSRGHFYGPQAKYEIISD